MNQHFNKMASNLNPPQDRRDAARDVPKLVRDYLRKCTAFPTIDPHTRLAGSYAQDMSSGDVKDVDTLVRVDGDPETNKPEAEQVIKDLLAALKALPDSEEGLGGWSVLNVEVKGARRSVNVYFEDFDFYLDVVPFIAPEGLDEPLYVPDKGFNKWVKSHPLGVVQLISNLDEEHSGKVRRLGKIFKHWRNHNMIYMKPKSYWLTALLLHHVQDTLDMEQTVPILFRNLLANIHEQFARTLERADAVPKIADPMLGHNVAHSWKRGDFESFMRHLEEGRKQMDRALEAANNCKLEDAVKICQDKLFSSEVFPTSVEDEIARMAAAGRPGAAYVSSQGIVSSTQPVAGRSTLSQPTKFYGEAAD